MNQEFKLEREINDENLFNINVHTQNEFIQKKHIKIVSNTFQTLKFIHCSQSCDSITFKKKRRDERIDSCVQNNERNEQLYYERNNDKRKNA